MGRRFALAAVAAAFIVSGVSVHADTALPPADGGSAIVAPRILSEADARRYREIFHDERTGRFAHALKLVADLSDRSLMGYVEAEHYLSPHSGRTSAAKLNAWLRDYGDLSIADRIRALSERRTRKKNRIPPAPTLVWRGGGYEDADLPDPPLESGRGRTALPQIREDIQNDRPDAALAFLDGVATDPSVPESDIARLTQKVAASYLAEHRDTDAYRVASGIGESARKWSPLLDWNAGFAAYRLGRYADAAPRFKALAGAGSVPSWTRAAAAFWAARSYMQAGEPGEVLSLLFAAAREEPTFYGLIAQRILGEEPQSDFREPVLDANGFAALMQVPAAHRAVALWQVGEKDDVPGEMNRAFAAIGMKDGTAFAALAQEMVLPNLELRASETEASSGTMLTGLFPVPKYKPDGGYTLDPSLVLAVARVESRFEADAVSGAGARGLMQLMPGTARHLAGGKIGEDSLDDPSTNLALGQRYLRQLLNRVNGNLFELAAAYNAGPANLSRWLDRQTDNRDDPLLFVESVPSPETRSYIKRFMMYHWLYRRRLDEDATSLDDAAAGKWPVYRPQTVPVAGILTKGKPFDAASD